MARLGALVEQHSDGLVVAYGAAGRATILFNAVPALAEHVAYVVDESPERVGRLMPGTRVPIVAPDRLAAEPPDVVVLSAWSYAELLVAKVRARVRKRQPSFCVPLPEPRLVV